LPTSTTAFLPETEFRCQLKIKIKNQIQVSSRKKDSTGSARKPELYHIGGREGVAALYNP